MSEPRIRYDETSDTLYIAFAPGESATGLELNPHILLRIDQAKRAAVGLTLFNFSLLAQPTAIGPRSFALSGLTELSKPLRVLALDLLGTAPVREFLALSAYTPGTVPTEIVPIACGRSGSLPVRPDQRLHAHYLAVGCAATAFANIVCPNAHHPAW